MDQLKNIEFWENHYLNQIEFTLLQDIEKMLDGLKSKDKIKDDWFPIFHKSDKKRQNSDFSRGAERIYYWLFNQFGIPQSLSIKSGILFETCNAYIHINIFTYNNYNDYENEFRNYFINTNTSKKKYNDKICLNYNINIIYEKSNNNFIRENNIISIPNIELFKIYKIKIKKISNNNLIFYNNYISYKLLENLPSRIKYLYKIK